MQVTWGEGGAVTVRDITHNVDVPNTGFPDGTYGFVQDANGNGVIDWQDFNGMPRVLDQINDESIFGGGDCDGFNGGDAAVQHPGRTAAHADGQPVDRACGRLRVRLG